MGTGLGVIPPYHNNKYTFTTPLLMMYTKMFLEGATSRMFKHDIHPRTNMTNWRHWITFDLVTYFFQRFYIL